MNVNEIQNRVAGTLKWIGHIKRIKEVEITKKGGRSRKLWLDRVDEINKKKGVKCSNTGSF